MEKSIQLWQESEKEKAVAYLLKNGFIEKKCKDGLFFQIPLPFQKETIELSILVPDNFPLSYPSVHISQNWFLKYPHIEKYSKEMGCKFCIYEPNEQPLISSGELLIENTYIRAIDVLKEYESSTSTDYVIDFFEEFDSYWSSKLKSIILDIDDLITMPTRLKTFNILVNNKSARPFMNQIAVTDDPEKIIQRFARTDISIEEGEDAIFIPLEEGFSYPFPLTTNEMFKCFAKEGYIDWVNAQYQTLNMDSMVIFSIMIESKKHFTAFQFKKIDVQKRTKSFIPLLSRVRPLLLNPELERYKVERVDRKRIFQRSGNKTTIDICRIDPLITIVGCGALGSSLALKLAKSGIRRFQLIDNDKFKYENIGRHICNNQHIGMYKAEALKSFLLDHFPDCSIEPTNFDAIESIGAISTSDLIIIATGAEGALFQQFLLNVKRLDKFFPPILCAWFEAGAIAGHSILIDQNVVEDIAKTVEKLNVLKDEYIDQFNAKDVGCASNFSPYAFVDADFITNITARMVIEYFMGSKVSDQAWSMLINTNQNKDKINDKYQNLDDLTLIKRSISDV